MKFEYPVGATPLDDISGLKLSWVQTHDDLNRAETESIFSAVDKYLLKGVGAAQTWFNIVTLKKIHYDMFADVWDWAGQFRSTQTIPGVRAYLIPSALETLCSDVQFWCSEECDLPLVEQAARVHHRLVFIHPFLNGNGRFSRLVVDRYLKAGRSPFPKWPTSLNSNGEPRKDYIKALILYMIHYGAEKHL